MMTCLTVGFLGAGRPARSGNAVDVDSLAGSAKLDAIVNRVIDRQRALATLRAQFTQIKKSSLLLADEESRGEFRFRAPDTVRWDFSGPEAMVVLFADDTVTTFHPGLNIAERVRISKRQRRFVGVLAGTQPLDELMQHFLVTMSDRGAPHPYRFTLRPATNTLAKRLALVEFDIDRELFLPIAVEVLEADGDSTRYEFRRVEINPEIDDGDFVLELGDGVRVEIIDASSAVG
jgi:outer membrane lipoprotein carrier protein